MDNKLRELEKENKRQEKILLELQKNSQSMLELKEYVSQELHRRDDWGKRAAQVQREAKERQIWVIKCPAPEEKKIRWGDYAYAVALKRYLDRMGMYTIIDLHEDWDCEVNADVFLYFEAANFTVRIVGTPNASTLCGISATRRWLLKKNTSSMILYA